MVCLHIYFLCSALNFFKERLSPLGNLFKFLGYSKEWWERIIFYHILPLSSISYVWWLTKSPQWSCYRWPYLGSLPLAQGLSWLGQITDSNLGLPQPKPYTPSIQCYFSEKQRPLRCHPLVEKKYQEIEYEVLSVRRRNWIETFGVYRKNKGWYSLCYRSWIKSRKDNNKRSFQFFKVASH